MKLPVECGGRMKISLEGKALENKHICMTPQVVAPLTYNSNTIFSPQEAHEPFQTILAKSSLQTL